MRRITDIVLGLLLGCLLLPVIGVLFLVVLIVEGRPVFFVQERMATPTRGFGLVKFRTMSVSDDDAAASGGHKRGRITPLGKVLRRTRLDELPQLWNILKGDMRFVGPRPPLRRYVDRFPGIYREVLKDKPGVTGLATLVFHRREEQLLDRCQTAEENEAVYERRCIPWKVRIDLIYARRRTACFDLRLMAATVFRHMSPVPRTRRR